MPISNREAEERVRTARTRLFLDHPFYGSLAMRLQLRPSEDCLDPNGNPTIATDGTELIFHPSFVEAQPDDKLRGVVAHEVNHAVFLHPFRFTTDRDPVLANMAMDFAINPMILGAGLQLPDGALVDRRFDGMAWEQIYAILERDPNKQPKPTGRPSPTGEVRPAPPQPQPGQAQPDPNGPPQPAPGPSKVQTEVDWQIAAEQAANVARKAGKLGADLDRAVKASHQSQADWRSILRQFIQEVIPSDYSMYPPNKRFIHQGLYMPSVSRQDTPRLVVVIDTSGSISPHELSLFASELTEILHEVRPESLDVLYCDTSVKHTESFSPDDAEVMLAAKGGGGTYFQPAFDYVAAQEQEPPAGLLYFTDLENGDNGKLKEPEYPVLWVTGEHIGKSGQFGETVRLSTWR